ncbi:MAG: DUF4292 domain-containing protein [Bacteroidales bacterium]|nr:DUF4292 domain-containing protein [Bacteroidales bacterium]
MYKVIFILSVVFVSTGCSVFQKAERSDFKVSGETNWKAIEKLVVNQNLTAHNFFINKARIDVVTNGAKESFLATIKFIYPDTFLISLRSKTGIEAARIYFTNDTILINDRINRKLFFGRPGNAGRKYGIVPEILPVMLGDFIDKNGNQLDNECIKGETVINTAIAGNKIRYVIDCKNAKVIAVSRESSNSNNPAVIKFGKFLSVAGIFFPSIINIDYSEMNVNIRIDKMEYPWNGNIEFIHGNNYELVELL